MFSRSAISCYHDFACGHGYLRTWQHRIGIRASPLCRFCDTEPETAKHILLECRIFRTHHTKLRQLCDANDLEFNLSTTLVEGILQLEVEKLLSTFLDLTRQEY